jgi:hypothetical protein
MALFGSARDASLVRHLNRELINEFIDTEIGFYKLSPKDSRINIYDETENKVYFQRLAINCIIRKDEKSYIADEAGYDQTRSGEFAFFRDDLKDKNIIVEEGDIIEYDNEFYEINSVGSSQYFAGKNPSTDLGFVRGQRNEFGKSISITATAHVVKRNRLNIQEVRSGVNKPQTIPRNL